MINQRLSYNETTRRFDLRSKTQVRSWERIYLEEGPEGLRIDKRGLGSTGRPPKLDKKVEEDLIAEVQRLRAENDYLKKLNALVIEEERRNRRRK
jgi:transposase-like protein